MAEQHSQGRQPAPSVPSSKPDSGSRKVSPEEMCHSTVAEDGDDIWHCSFEGCLSKPKDSRSKVIAHYQRYHKEPPHLCQYCDSRSHTRHDYRMHLRSAHTTGKHHKCKCEVTSYNHEQHYEQHLKEWCPERPRRDPGWEGREWDSREKRFEPVSSLPSASSSTRPAPPQPYRDPVLASGIPEVDFTGRSALPGEGQGYLPLTNNPSLLTNQHLHESASLESPLHYQPIPNSFAPHHDESHRFQFFAPSDPPHDPVFDSAPQSIRGQLNPPTQEVNLDAVTYEMNQSDPPFGNNLYLPKHYPNPSLRLVHPFDQVQPLPFQHPYPGLASDPPEDAYIALQQPRTAFNGFESNQGGYPQSGDRFTDPAHQLDYPSAFPSHLSPSQMPSYQPAYRDQSSSSFPPTPFLSHPQPHSLSPATSLRSAPYIPTARQSAAPIVLDPLPYPIQRSDRRRGGGPSNSSRPPHSSAREPYSRSRRPSNRSAPSPNGVSRPFSQIEDNGFGLIHDRTLQRSLPKLGRRQARCYGQNVVM